MNKPVLIFENSPREVVRICLHLENLMQKIIYFSGQSNAHASRVVIESVLYYLNVAERPDFRNKMLRLVGQCLEFLIALESNPEVDSHRLTQLVAQMDDCKDWLYANPDKIGQVVDQHGLLTLTRKQTYSSGGVCDYLSPQMVTWLHRSHADRRELMSQWIDGLKPLDRVIGHVLSFMRMMSAMRTCQAKNGQYQHALDQGMGELQLVRVGLLDANHFADIRVSARWVFVYLCHADQSGSISLRGDEKSLLEANIELDDDDGHAETADTHGEGDVDLATSIHTDKKTQVECQNQKSNVQQQQAPVQFQMACCSL